MKKTITLLSIAALLTSASFAQYDRRGDYNHGNRADREIASNDSRGYGYGGGTYYFSARDKNMQIMGINREYNDRIESIKHRIFMSRSKKERIICSLEAERDAAIRSVIDKFNDRRNRYDGGDNWHNDHDRRHKW